ncbi:MAG: VCBS repeat-containing protein [Bacteroidetes bacterium]|nr:VCBS repeat-containing protein [Bacteroidota bacterium]
MKLAVAGFGLFLIGSLVSCSAKKETVFTELSASETHIDFRNDIKENEDYNVLTYEYIYNGGGVAVGDVDGDGLPDLYFTANMGPDKLYLNKGEFKFEDVTGKAGVAGRSRWKTGTVMADVNGDGLLDLYVCYSGPGTDVERSNELYINNGVKDGVPRFTESAKAYGLDAPGTYTTTVSFFDMDNDGDLDLFMVNHAAMFYNPFYNTDQLRAKRNSQAGNRLYRNDNGHFTDVSEQARIYGSGLNFGLSVSISDVNNDGWADIYTTNDYDERDFLYLNNHDGTFREVLDKAVGHLSEFAMGSDIADYNNDGLPDIMVLDMLPESNHRQKLLRGADTYDKYTMRVDHGLGHQQMRNTLQLNRGVDSSGMPVFSEVGQLAGVSATDWSWAPLFADFDNDGWKDLFVSNGILRDITNLDFVKYTSGYSSNYKEVGGDKKEMWKLLQDMPSTPLTNYMFRNNHELGFTDVTKEWGITGKGIHDGAVYADLDNDGDLDLVVNNLNDGVMVYRNNGAGGHYLRLQLRGEGKNTFGMGAKVSVVSAHLSQEQEEYTSRGFQSSVDPVMHVGLGGDSVASLVVRWPSGKVISMKEVRADTLLVLDEREGNVLPDGSSKVVSGFRDVTAGSGVKFVHSQAPTIDFKISPLLPFQVSKTGPSVAKGDVNGDGLEDLFIGASAGYESQLYLQTKEGKFVLAADQPWNQSKEYTNSDALLFDADGDGDLDLYLVSGGADYPLNDKHYQDRFFQNDGKGHFRLLVDALPAEVVSGSCVRAADIDKDGLPDLFVGGYVQPGLFPAPPESMILKNRSKGGQIRFEKDVSLADCGMVADALWMDLNKDGWMDLVVAGPFMPVSVFENHTGKLVNQTKEYGLDSTRGWWCRLAAVGDDIIAGNLGLNTQFQAGPSTPLTITYGDFDKDGVMDPMLCYYKDGKSYPYCTRDELFDQMPVLQKKFSRYADYADAQLTDLFTAEQLATGKTVSIQEMRSLLLRRDGKRFRPEALPVEAQMSPVNGIVVRDFDGDGLQDLLLAGNFYPLRAQQGPLDAGMGILLKRSARGSFVPVANEGIRLSMMGDIRNITSVKTAAGLLIVAVKNNGPVQLVRP